MFVSAVLLRRKGAEAAELFCVRFYDSLADCTRSCSPLFLFQYFKDLRAGTGFLVSCSFSLLHRVENDGLALLNCADPIPTPSGGE